MLTRCTTRIAAIACAVTLTLGFMPTAHADPLPNLTAEQWAGLPALVHWYEVTASWTLADWYWWGIKLSADRHRSDWERVAMCEQGGNWKANGSKYTGGLGFLHATWRHYGGLEFAPNAGAATEDQQIIVANRVADATGFDVQKHDLNGRCTGW